MCKNAVAYAIVFGIITTCAAFGWFLGNSIYDAFMALL